jgi:hypothetical protein
MSIVRRVAGARAYVVEARLILDEGYEPAAVGAAVTTDLCGHWEHSGPCRWPHNSAIETSEAPAVFRTVFVADEAEADAVSTRIEGVLRAAPGWQLWSVGSRPVAASERGLAERLIAGPRLR